MGDSQWNPPVWGGPPPLIPVHFSASAPPPGELVKLEKPDGPTEYGPDGGYSDGPPHYDHSAFFQPIFPPGQSSMPGSSMALEEELKRDKEAIYSHPFFPLLTCLFEKCELATCTPKDQPRDGANDVVSAASFKEDLDVFTKTMQTHKPYYTPNPALDDLMLQAITMLRFHLLELEKVHELCDNFCQRYVTCLKSKLPIDIVGEERCDEPRASSSNATGSPLHPGSSSPGMSTPMNHYQPPPLIPPFEPQTVPLPESTSAMSHNLESLQGSSYVPLIPSSTQSPHPLVLDGSVMVASDQTSSSSQTAALSPTPSSTGGVRNGSTPLYDSQLNPNPASIESTETGPILSYLDYPYYSTLTTMTHSHSSIILHHPSDPSQEDSPDSSLRGSNKRRGIFPKTATNTMRHWLFKHLTHPYPSEEQKKQLANDTGLTILQVNNWFINARRRIVQPMIDQSNRAGRTPLNVFRGRRRERDSESGTPEGNGSTTNGDTVSAPSTYSPDPSPIVPSMYPSTGADLSYMQRASSMFTNPYPFNPSMSTPFLMPNMFNGTAPLGTSWPMDPLSHMTQMD